MKLDVALAVRGRLLQPITVALVVREKLSFTSFVPMAYAKKSVLCDQNDRQGFPHENHT